MKKKILKDMKKFFENPKTSLAIGIILLFCGIMETSETIIEKFLGIEIEIFMGITIFATAQILLAITHILEGIEDVGISQLVEDIEALEEESSHREL